MILGRVVEFHGNLDTPGIPLQVYDRYEGQHSCLLGTTRLAVRQMGHAGDFFLQLGIGPDRDA